MQLILGQGSVSLFSRTGDDIAGAFPDLVDNVFGEAVLDGELLVGRDLEPAPFNDLQQRLNRKVATAKLIEDYPAFIRVYDMLFDGRAGHPRAATGPSVGSTSKLGSNTIRRPGWMSARSFRSTDWDDLAEMRRRGAAEHGP